MSSEDGEVYIMTGVGDEEWVSPTPAQTAITDAVTGATDLTEADIGDVETYVDLEELRAVLDGGSGDLTFDVEGHDVTVTGDGDISVE
ncbi:HalOD1 output domain-containing protein [Salinibaculum salinum]|uniref:HalOD1 output domain-containing protein n=1 Tax=Salinibaculum salinum TaxID=3131996 RepID=UPI0030EDE3F8